MRLYIGLPQLGITIAKMYHLMPTKICLWDYAQSSIMNCLSAEWSKSHRDKMVSILSIIDPKQLVNPITSLTTENKPGPISNVHHVGCTFSPQCMYVLRIYCHVHSACNVRLKNLSLAMQVQWFYRFKILINMHMTMTTRYIQFWKH